MKDLHDSISKVSYEILGIDKVKREHLEPYRSAETKRVTMLEFMFPKIMKHTKIMERDVLILGSPFKQHFPIQT